MFRSRNILEWILFDGEVPISDIKQRIKIREINYASYLVMLSLILAADEIASHGLIIYENGIW